MAEPRVTVVIPVRNEADRLPGCLAALAAQDLDPATIEVLVVDGGSTDATVEVARRILAENGWARAEVLVSAPGDRSSNLNCGLQNASSSIVARVDARSRIPADYLRRCIDLLDSRPDVAVVGGRQRAVPCGPGPVDAGVARALNNRWGMGLARYRRATGSGGADTVYLGAYRTAELRVAGGWRTDFVVNEDFDLNRRLATYGTVWFDADLTVDYIPRSSLGALLRQYWAFGLGKARYWRVSGDRPRPRQVMLLAAPPSAVLGLVAARLGLGLSQVWPLLVGAAAACAVEVAGSHDPHGGLRSHAAALVALGCVGAGWLAGVAAGTVAGLVRKAGDRLRSLVARPAAGRP